MSKLIPLGLALIFRDADTHELVVDEDTLTRDGAGFAGTPSFAGDPGYDDEYDDDFAGEYSVDDEFGYDDELDEYDDEFGYEDEEVDEFGRRRLPRGQRKARRQARRQARQGRRQARRRPPVLEPPPTNHEAWGKTALAGRDTLADQGTASVKLRLQHDFKAEDITFVGSVAGAKVTSIFMGDRVVWANADGIDVSVFSSNSFVRGMLKGQSLKAGLDITVNGELPSGGDFAVTLLGLKPIHC
ncbi:MAG: hypothetical protein EP330_08595 [Deltaproteobacteria bacterium]|nr:MAG: hypothetical protein EP330_08595 [Deltaproteobacteria bacterium]